MSIGWYSKIKFPFEADVPYGDFTNRAVSIEITADHVAAHCPCKHCHDVLKVSGECTHESRTVEELLSQNIRWPVKNREGCTIDAAGQLYDCEGKHCKRESHPSGRVYYPFERAGMVSFKVWALNALYTAAKGSVPNGHKVEPLDGNHNNLRFDNLGLIEGA